MTEKQILSLSRQNGSLTNALETMPQVGLWLSDGSEYPEKGRIDAISGIIDTSTGAVTLRAVFPNPERILRSGGTGNIRVPLREKRLHRHSPDRHIRIAGQGVRLQGRGRENQIRTDYGVRHQRREGVYRGIRSGNGRRDYRRRGGTAA